MMRGLRSVASVALVALATPLALAACSRSNSSDAHGHDHGDQGQARGGDAAHGHAEDGPDPIAITRWAGGHELFVELTPPAPDREVAYAAHVTRLSDFKPVEKGSFTVRFERAGATLGQATAKTVSRAGIYIFRAKAPEAGSYELSMSYQHGDEEVTFDCGTIAVGDAPAPDPPRPGMAFLKEQQWRIPFATDWAGARAIAREVELPAVVEPAGTDRLTISAPTSGRFFHNPKLKLAEGLHIDKNALIGRIAPTVAGDDYTRLTLAVDESRLGKQQAERELKRIEPLVKDGLLPDKRIIDTRNDIERHDAQLRAARERLARVTAPQGKGGLALRSSLEGVVTEILVPNGEPVEPGQSLLRIGGEQSRWVRARFVARPDEPMLDARAVAVRTPGGKRLELEGRARLLSSHPTVEPRTQLATFIAEVSGGDHGESSHELRTGTHVVLLIQVGKKEQRLTVPKSAVVDINTRRYVFVQTGGEEFEKRRVVLGDSDGAFVHVVEGVEDGERVVTRGGYDIHLASIMGQVESHRH